MSDLTAAHPVRRPRPTSVDQRNDVWLAAGLFLAAVLSTALGSVAGVYGADATEGMQWALLYSLGLTAPLAVRRRLPEVVVVVIAVVFFVGVTLRIPDLYVSNIAMFIAMYTVGAWVDDRRRALWVRVGVIVAMFVWLIVTMFQTAIDPADDGLSRAGVFSPFAAMLLLQLLVNAGFFGGAYYMGDRAYAAAMSRSALEQRTRELEREREVTAAQAVALDRVRIARELHDVVAHHVSAMGVQAGAARRVLDTDRDLARTALETVEQTARTSIGELRGLLGVLRSDADADSDATAAPGLEQVPDLVAGARSAGLDVDLVCGLNHGECNRLRMRCRFDMNGASCPSTHRVTRTLPIFNTSICLQY